MKNYRLKIFFAGLFIGIVNNICLGQEKYVVSAEEGLNLRATASMDGQIKKTYPYGTSVWVSKINNGWATIVDHPRTMDPSGYTDSDYLKNYNTVIKEPPILVIGDTLQHRYILSVSNLNDYNIGYGVGIDMRDPSNPHGTRGSIAFLKNKLPTIPKILNTINDSTAPINNSTWKYHTRFLETDTTEEFLHVLNANFKASYKKMGVKVKGDASVDKNSSDITKHHNILFIIEAICSPDISESEFVFSARPESENISSEYQALNSFLFNYGSHYIYKIDYGYRIVIKASIDNDNCTSTELLSAHIKANIHGFKAKGEIENQNKDSLQEEHIEIESVILGGGIYPDRVINFNSFDGVNSFLEELNEGEITIYGCPIRIHIESYLPHLYKFPKTQGLFRD